MTEATAEKVESGTEPAVIEPTNGKGDNEESKDCSSPELSETNAAAPPQDEAGESEARHLAGATVAAATAASQELESSNSVHVTQDEAAAAKESANGDNGDESAEAATTTTTTTNGAQEPNDTIKDGGASADLGTPASEAAEINCSSCETAGSADDKLAMDQAGAIEESKLKDNATDSKVADNNDSPPTKGVTVKDTEPTSDTGSKAVDTEDSSSTKETSPKAEAAEELALKSDATEEAKGDPKSDDETAKTKNRSTSPANSLQKGIKVDENKNGESNGSEKKEAESQKERKGIISDASTLPKSDNPKEIREQVEFYFGDANLRWDKYLFGLVTKENKYVELKIVHSFKRMLRFNLDDVAPALESSELLELNEAKDAVRRKVPMTKPSSGDGKTSDRVIDRSLYMRGFGVEEPTSQFDIESYFKQSADVNVSAVRLRRDDQKIFKGSVFVEFKHSDDLKKWLDISDKPEWKDKKPTLLTVEEEREDDRTEFSGSVEDKASKDAEGGLRYMTKKAFVEMKNEDIKSGRIKASESSQYVKNRSNKFDAFADDRDGSSGRQHHNRDRNDRRPDLRHDKWKRGEEVKDGRRGGGDRDRDRDRDRGHRGGRGGFNSRGRGGDRHHRGGGGYKGDRNDRGERRGSGRRESNDRKDGPRGQKYDEKGIPIVRALSRSPSPNKRSPKRSRDDEGSGDKSPKKAKTEADENKSNGSQKRQREDDGNDVKNESPPSQKKAKAEVEA